MELEAQLVDLLTKQTAILERMDKKDDLKTKTPANFGTAVELHGEGSLFGSQSIEREVVSAHIRPQGILGAIPWIPTVYTTPFFASITGFSADVGAEAAFPCSDNPVTMMKGCNLTASFGRVARDTRTIEINDVMLKRNRGDYTDLMLYGKLLGLTGMTPAGMDESDVLNVVTKSEMVAAGVSLERILNVWSFQGNPATGNAGGGYKPFAGLDRQIATGQVDAETNSACAALDSDVKTFGYQNVEDPPNSLYDIVRHVSTMEAFLRFNAQRMGLEPVQYIISMRPELWFTLSDIWPCQYNANKCGQTVVDSNVMITLGGENMIAARDAMRQGMYLDINGRRYPVLLSDGIYEATNITGPAAIKAGEYASSLYFIPLTIMGGLPVTYMEYVDYRKAAPDIALLGGSQQFWSDDGMFFWAVEYVKWCYKLSVKVESRLVLRTPQLAGRIDAIKYRPLQHFRSSDPTSPYFADGGVSMRPDQYYKHVW
jgi:hypothetical protein